MNRRQVLQLMAVGIVAPMFLSSEQATKILPPWLPQLSDEPAWLIPRKVGVDFNGTVGGIFIEIAKIEPERGVQVLVTRPNGDLMLHHFFNSRGHFQWFPAYEHELLHGPMNVSCSETALIILSGPHGQRLFDV